MLRSGLDKANGMASMPLETIAKSLEYCVEAVVNNTEAVKEVMAWKSVSTYILNHCIYRNCCKVSGWTVCLKWLIKWLVTCIVRNPGICKVDSYFFYSDAGTSACLTYIDHYIRVLFFDCRFNRQIMQQGKVIIPEPVLY